MLFINYIQSNIDLSIMITYDLIQKFAIYTMYKQKHFSQFL